MVKGHLSGCGLHGTAMFPLFFKSQLYSSFKDLETVAQYIYQPKTGVLLEDQVEPSLLGKCYLGVWTQQTKQTEPSVSICSAFNTAGTIFTQF